MKETTPRRPTDLEDLLAGLKGVFRPPQEPSDEGLRERKKRLTRRQISDTATAMFLERGFEGVKVSEIAEACGVSEKTVFNYFPTKETLLLDREDEMAAELRRRLGPEAGNASPVESVLSLILEMLDEVSPFFVPGADAERGISRFVDLITGTPSLRAAQSDMTERLAQVAAVAMAERAGVNPDDPEPQVAADAMLALWRVYWGAIRRHAANARSSAELCEAVSSDLLRAARLIDTGLWSFGLAVQGSNGRQQLQAATEAANEARKQVLNAIRQAREAWRVLKSAHDHGAVRPRDIEHERAQLRAAQRAAQQARRDVQSAGWQLRRAVDEAMRQDQAAARGRRRPPKAAP